MEIPRLHPETIEEVKQRVDIVDVVSEHVVLKKRGKDYVGLCPFHDEKTPSFSVSPGKQMYYCFGCGTGGNALKFLMELGKQSFSDVVFELARRYQVPIKTLEPEQRQELQRQLSLREQLYEVLAVAASFYQHALRQPQGEKALSYLQQERQLDEETIQQFQLGYAPAGWETLYRYLVEQKRYPIALAEEAGLIKPRQKGGGYYDQFRDRLMIPIQDAQGRIIAFGSRSLGEEEPKYLNSPETPLFTKGKTLFALDKAKTSIQKQDRAVVVEGYFDAIALHSFGITNAVASLGTAFSQDQLRQLLRYTDSKRVIFNFDADAAGTKATQRAIGDIAVLVYSGQVQLRIFNLPDGKDADEFLKSSPEAADKYRQLLEDAPLWLDWQIQQLVRDRNLKQADEFQQAAQGMLKLLNQIEDSNKRAYYVNYSAEVLSQGDSRLIALHTSSLLTQLKKTQRRFPQQKSSPSPLKLVPSSEDSSLEKAEALLLLIYLHCPEHRQEIAEILEAKDLIFNFSHHRFLWQQLTELEAETSQPLNNSSNQLLSRLQDLYLGFPEKMAQISHLFQLTEKSKEDIFRASLQIQKVITSLEQESWKHYRRYCLEQWRYQDPDRQQYYWQELDSAQQRLKELNQH